MGRKKINEDMKTRSRGWTCLLYAWDRNYNANDILSKVRYLTYAYCLHNEDLLYKMEDYYEDDVYIKKKPHYHIVLYFRDARSRSSVASLLGFSDEQALRFLQPITDVASMIRYLVHWCDQDKYQYSVDEIIHSPEWDIKTYFGGMDLSSIEQFLSYVERFKPNELEVILLAKEMNCEDTLLKYQSLIGSYIRRNLPYTKNK